MNKTILDLGLQPIVNNLFATKEQSLNAKKYPMSATMDSNLLIKLDTIIPSEELYEKYLYHSAVNKPYVYHCQKMWHSIKHLKHDTIIDVGGNDGTLLKAFRSQSVDSLRLINVDASASFREENLEAGIEYVNDYFNEELELPKANIITSTNVFQHTPGAEKFLAAVREHLADDGVWILEFPYTLRTFETLQFDQFYHEHYYYWLVTPLVKLFDKYGLRIINTEEQSIHGGTLRLWIAHKKHSNSTGAADEYLASGYRPLAAYDPRFSAGPDAPLNEAADQQLWYNPNFADVDIMVHNGNTFVGYRHATAPYYEAATATLRTGYLPVVAASNPYVAGVTVSGDLWISTADLENFPTIYRYNNNLTDIGDVAQRWELVDKTDQTTEEGVLFADARWNKCFYY